MQGRFGISWQQHLDTITNDISVNNIAMATLLFALVQRFAPERYDRQSRPMTATWWPMLSKCTFGIYLSQKRGVDSFNLVVLLGKADVAQQPV